MTGKVVERSKMGHEGVTPGAVLVREKANGPSRGEVDRGRRLRRSHELEY